MALARPAAVQGGYHSCFTVTCTVCLYIVQASYSQPEGGFSSELFTTVSAIETETSEQKNVSNIFFFSENILFNTIENI
jgi:hypothetical protein